MLSQKRGQEEVGMEREQRTRWEGRWVNWDLDIKPGAVS